ncbi:MAG: ATP-binding protein [Bdellovibrio sp.]
MKIQSLIQEADRLVPVEVEVSFTPGLPQIYFMGLPDQAIKESAHRIKTALRMQGFEFPRAQQVLVNLRPAHLKKTSRGLDLAVALGILWESQQLPLPEEPSFFVYGEVSLSGEIFEPEDLTESFYWEHERVAVWTGQSEVLQASFPRWCYSSLAQLRETPEVISACPLHYDIERPQEFIEWRFPARQAELLELVALGEHSLLLAGPAGSGKSTLAKAVHALLQEPTALEMREILRNNRSFLNEDLKWRPLAHPHHSISPLGLMGGGVPPCKGEITRAHKGVLILDELLEFHPRAQEALREPMEEGKVRLRRGRYVEEHLAETLVLATTNLCPCGDWVPQVRIVCGRSLRRCQSYLEKLSGPLVDRFQILFFTSKQEKGRDVAASDILIKLEKVRKFRQALAERDPRFRQVAARWSWEELAQDLPPFYWQELFPREMNSRRRDLSTLRVARTFADLALREKMEASDIEKALPWTFHSFVSLRKF